MDTLLLRSGEIDNLTLIIAGYILWRASRWVDGVPDPVTDSGDRILRATTIALAFSAWGFFSIGLYGALWNWYTL